jgi:hypothetical protein
MHIDQVVKTLLEDAIKPDSNEQYSQTWQDPMKGRFCGPSKPEYSNHKEYSAKTNWWKSCFGNQFAFCSGGDSIVAALVPDVDAYRGDNTNQ